MLNWSGERDEQEDFELNIRVVSGGLGLIVLPNSDVQDTNVQNFNPLANGGRNQLKVRGVPAWDAIKAFEQFGIRSPISPLKATDVDVAAGRALFGAANCQACHGGPTWTNSRVPFTPPPDTNVVRIVAGQVVSELRNVGSFDPTFFNEVRQNPAAGAPLGAAGFVPPSLLSIHAFPGVFFHNGAVVSLEQVMNNVVHRSAGTAGVDTLTSSADRDKVVKFLLSIDASTVPFARP
jgi:cytochrome c peroxidase